MSIKSMFFNAVLDGGVYDRTYNAEDVTSYLDKIVGSGVFPNPSTQLQVVATSGMHVGVTQGQGWIDGHKVVNTATEELTIDAADVLLPRIDAIVMYADVSERAMGFAVKKGTAASSPSAPAITRTSTRKEYRLANVRVNAGATSITTGAITDTRSSSDCGWVTGLIEQVDTSTLFNQYQAAYNEAMAAMQTLQASMQAQFEDWMETLTEQLTVKTYVQFFNKVATGTGSQVRNITLDMSGYKHDASDFILVFINGLVAREGVDWYPAAVSQQLRIVTQLDAQSENNVVNIYVIKSKIGFAPLVTSGGDYLVTSDDDNIIG